VIQGAALPEDLEEEEEELGEMTGQLEQLRTSYNTLWSQASGVLKNLTGSATIVTADGASPAAASAQPPPPAPAVAPPPAPASSAGGSMKGGTQSSAGEAASKAVYAGLKFSGLAMRITQDIAYAVKADAKRMLKVRVGRLDRQNSAGPI